MELRTHLEIDPALCGEPTKLEEGFAEVRLHTTTQMRADGRGLVHGGFVFSALDYAAMLAVNDPNVVLGASELRFLAPVSVGDEVICSARATANEGKKRIVEVEAKVGEKSVAKGTLTTFVLPKHVLD